MKWGAVVGAGVLSLAAVGFAAPAAAGCEDQTYTETCDGPVQPDGSWFRCVHTLAQGTYSPTGQVVGILPATDRCFPVDPNRFPALQLGQPEFHVAP